MPLDDVGVDQAREAAARLASLRPAAIVSSDLCRAADTARELAPVTGLDVAYDRRLREIDFGEREGLTLAESLARFPDADAPLAAVGGGAVSRAARPIRRPPSGSPPRCTDVVAAMSADDTVVVASHGGAMRVGTCRFLGFPRHAVGRLRRLRQLQLDGAVREPATAGGSTSGTPARCLSR